MKLRPFTFARAQSIEEALSLWRESDAMFISGGQGLLSEMGLGIRRPARLVDVSTVGSLSAIESTDDAVRIGAGVTVAGLATGGRASDPLLRQAARHVAVEPVRTLATLGGNFCHGNPTAELPLAAFVAGAHVLGVARDGTHMSLGAAQWAQLRPADDVSPLLVTALEWPRIDNVASTGFVELGEQATFVPEVAIAWMAFHARDEAEEELRVGVALREGGRFLVAAGRGGPSPDEVAAAMASAGVESRLSPTWLSDVIGDAAGTARGAGVGSMEATP